jgi:hypothetical protein
MLCSRNYHKDTATLAWQWLLEISKANEHDKPKVSSVWTSALLPHHSLVRRRVLAVDTYYYILWTSSWGAFAWTMDAHLSQFADHRFYTFSVLSKEPLQAVFMTDVKQWAVVPTEIVSPSRVRLLCGQSILGICLVQQGPECGVLNWTFERGECSINLTVANIEALLTSLGALIPRGNKEQKAMQLLRTLFPERAEEELVAMLANIMKPKLTETDKMAAVVQAHPELALGLESMMQLDASARGDFRDLENSVRKHVLGEEALPHDPPGAGCNTNFMAARASRAP